MTATTGTAFVLLCVIAFVIAADVVRAPRMHMLRKRLRREKNRNRFGELRTKLVRLAVAGEVNPKSPVFDGVYRGTTSLMRNPYALDAAAAAIMTIPAPEQQRGMKKPTRAEGEIAQEFADRLDLLCRDHSKVYLVGAWFVDRCKGADWMPPLWVQMVRARAENERVKAVAEARKRLEGTAQLASC